MAALKALAPVFDAGTGRTYMPGRAFDIEDGRAAALVAAGAASYAGGRAAEPEPQEAPAEDPAEGVPQEAADLSALYEGMTRDQLIEAASVHGVEVPGKATKAQIIALLAGAR